MTLGLCLSVCKIGTKISASILVSLPHVLLSAQVVTVVVFDDTFLKRVILVAYVMLGFIRVDCVFSGFFCLKKKRCVRKAVLSQEGP